MLRSPAEYARQLDFLEMRQATSVESVRWQPATHRRQIHIDYPAWQKPTIAQIPIHLLLSR